MLEPEGGILDARTLYFACAVLEFCCLCAIGLVYQTHREEPAVKYWCYSFCLAAIGLFLFTLPPTATVLFARNTLLILCYGLAYQGVAVFLRKPSYWRYLVPFAAMGIVGCAFWSYVDNHLGWRNFSYSIAVSPYLATIALLFIRQPSYGGETFIYRLLAAMHFGTLLGLAVRIGPLFDAGRVEVTEVNVGLAGPVGTLLISMALFLKCFLYALLINGRLKRRLEFRANIDPLTKLLNRRGFNQKVGRIQGACGLIVADLDKFKCINDTYGHLVGDAVLTSFASMLCAQIRDEDVCSRAGGEEFWIALPGLNKEEASKIAERLKEVVAATPVHVNGKALKFTASFGVADSEVVSGKDIVLAINRADEALLRAKEQGRNQVVCAHDLAPACSLHA